MAPEAALRRGRGSLWLLLLLNAPLGCGVLGPLPSVRIFEQPIEINFERPADLIPPERIRITSTADREIWLAWDPVLVGDVAGYVVTRAEDAAGPYQAIGQTLSRFDT